MRQDLISGISAGFPTLSQSQGQVTHVLLTRSPLIHPASWASPFDLHVLSTPPAFVLSQDQTLRKSIAPTRPKPGQQPYEADHPKKEMAQQNWPQPCGPLTNHTISHTKATHHQPDPPQRQTQPGSRQPKWHQLSSTLLSSQGTGTHHQDPHQPAGTHPGQLLHLSGPFARGQTSLAEDPDPAFVPPSPERAPPSMACSRGVSPRGPASAALASLAVRASLAATSRTLRGPVVAGQIPCA